MTSEIRTSRISIIIPAYNEDKTLFRNMEKLMKFLEKSFKKYEIIICDNGSKDNTSEVGNLLAKKHKLIKFFRIPKKGFGLAEKEMIRRAKYEKIVLMSADISFNLSFIKEAERLLEDFDVVVGSKRTEGSIDQRPIKRKILSSVFNFLVNLFLGVAIKDTQGVKGYRKSKIKIINEKIKSKNFFYDVEMLWYARKNKLKIIEIPVKVRDYKKSKVKLLSDSAKLFFEILGFWLKMEFSYKE